MARTTKYILEKSPELYFVITKADFNTYSHYVVIAAETRLCDQATSAMNTVHWVLPTALPKAPFLAISSSYCPL